MLRNGGATDCQCAVIERSSCETASLPQPANQSAKLETERDEGADEARVTRARVPGCSAFLLGELAQGQLTLNITGQPGSFGRLVVESRCPLVELGSACVRALVRLLLTASHTGIVGAADHRPSIIRRRKTLLASMPGARHIVRLFELTSGAVSGCGALPGWPDDSGLVTVW